MAPKKSLKEKTIVEHQRVNRVGFAGFNFVSVISFCLMADPRGIQETKLLERGRNVSQRNYLGKESTATDNALLDCWLPHNLAREPNCA